MDNCRSLIKKPAQARIQGLSKSTDANNNYTVFLRLIAFHTGSIESSLPLLFYYYFLTELFFNIIKYHNILF